jgi:hypothetical protein
MEATEAAAMKPTDAGVKATTVEPAETAAVKTAAPTMKAPSAAPAMRCIGDDGLERRRGEQQCGRCASQRAAGFGFGRNPDNLIHRLLLSESRGVELQWQANAAFNLVRWHLMCDCAFDAPS